MFTTAARDSTDGLARIVALVMDGYAGRPALGERVKEAVIDPVSGRKMLRLLPRFTTITYAELWERAGATAAEWHLDGRRPVNAGDFVALYGFTSADYTVLDLACLRLGAVTVPLPSNAPVARLAPIVEETAPRVLAASLEVLDSAVELVLSATSKPRLLVFDYHPDVDDEREKLEAAGERLARAGLSALDTLAVVIERGRSLPDVPLPRPKPDEDPMQLLLYTSGSTGSPKGAIYTERMQHLLWAGVGHASAEHVVSINYMPLSHTAGRAALYGTLSRGGTACFTAKSDMSTLLEDMELARPTELLLVPRICEMLFQEYQREMARRSSESADRRALEAAVAADLRDRLLGGRVREVSCGSAPLSPELKRFLESALGLPLHNVYGSTEAGVPLRDSRVLRPPVIAYKLVDVPELGYFTTDLPYPRGELLLKMTSMARGYYKRPEVTAEVFTEDGFYRTGDIMAETGPDQLIYIDRRNNVLKLAQGEFVTISRLESVLVSSPLIRQIFVYGNSERAYPLAVVVPTEQAIEQAASHEDLKLAIGESMQRIARQAELESYEIPRDFLIDTEPFTVTNGLLSELRKPLRPQLKARYGDRLEALYDQLASGQEDALRALREAGPERPVFETIRRAAGVLLGCSPADLTATVHFTDLGVDSLSALSFSRLLRDVLDVEIPVGVLLSPANDLRTIADHIETERALGVKRPSFAAVHGADATQLSAADLTLEKFLDKEVLENAGRLPRAVQATPQTILLTGANGFLGRFMCLDWLERIAETGGRLICLVRGRDAADARHRLCAAFDTGDADLLRRYQNLAGDHLDVVPGDIGLQHLGLDQDTWSRLAADVDLVLHPAALVNHVLPYDQLFGPNVVGTAEVIRLALTGKVKPVTYISTVGMASELDPAQLDETADIRKVCPARTLSDTYASGYASSKWAGEVLLREAHETCGLPVTVFRSDMILAHTRHAGQLNVPDMFTRLLFSLVTTGIAPASFYRTDTKETLPHYDGLPVDFVAQAVNTLSVRNTDRYRTYNVVNPHDDGISLDTFVDWLTDAGHPIHRIDSYDDWFTRFETALRALPEAQRSHSLLPLLHAYRHPDDPMNGSPIPSDRFARAVREAGIGADNDIPHLSAALIVKYVTDLRGLNLLQI
ncbi:carboxylic acid reductase [Spirillospora sp. NPDC048911]|uniref:carboxylic acid reductase n=1 Tax=Spirillospora sp. NPDC048911 TaxID=3364527 RepID=UPI003710BF0C